MVQTLSSRTATELAGLTDRLAEPIRAHRDEANRQRRLPDELIEPLRDAGAFSLFNPTERGGFEAPLASAIEVFEAFGYLDGPVAWNIWNGNVGFVAAILEDAAVDRIWARPDPIIANSARPVTMAEPVDGGYRLSGRWDIVSAIDIADWVCLFALVPTDAGPDVRVMVVPIEDVEVLDTWDTHGMRGTGSKTALVDGAFVPEAFVTSPFAPARLDRPLYRIPAFTLALSGSAPIVLGIARAALDEIIGIAPTKGTDSGVLAERAHAQDQVGAAHTALRAARLALVDSAARIDDAATAGGPVDERLRAELRAAMCLAATTTRDVLDTCQRLASSTAIFADNRITQLVLDGQVATQHALLAPSHQAILGRLLLGQPAGTPVI